VATAIGFLDKYNVSYIYVGGLEHSYYTEAGLAKFPELLGGTLERVYSNEQVNIYRVLR